MNPDIMCLKMHGHQGPVTCLDYMGSESRANEQLPACLLSGSEDGTARLWDLREHFRASLCIKAPEPLDGELIHQEILSVAFGSACEVCSTPHETTAAASPFARRFSVYLSVGEYVHEYDLRKATSPVISLSRSDMIFQADDDVNHISMGTPYRGITQISIADDAGRITLLNRATSSLKASLLHNDQALVMSALFRPGNHKTLQLVSGGTDCRLALWDVAKPRVPSSTLLIQALSKDAKQICNPPMIHSLAWSPTGRLLAAALGDGSCAICQVANNRSLVMAARLDEAHESAVASVLFPRWSGADQASAPSDRLLCSVGNEGKIVLWDLGPSLGGDEASDPRQLFSTASPMAETMDDLLGQPQQILTWSHTGGKPNWMVASRRGDAPFPSALFLADTSNDITVYSIQMS